MMALILLSALSASQVCIKSSTDIVHGHLILSTVTVNIVEKAYVSIL